MGEKYNNFCCYQNMLGELQNIAENSIDSIVRPIINRFESSISKTLQDILPDESVSFFNGIHKGYYQVFIEKWPKTVHFEFIPFDNIKLLSGKVYSLVLHVENKDLQQKFSDLLEKEEIANKARERLQNNPNIMIRLRKKGMTDEEIYKYVSDKVANSVTNSKDFADHMKDEKRKAKDRETKWGIYGDITGNASSIVRKIDGDYIHNLPDIIVTPSDQRYFNIQGLPEFPIK